MDQTRRRVGELRQICETLRADRTPIDVVTFLEIGQEGNEFAGYRRHFSLKAFRA